MTLVPAYGRDYRSRAAAQADFDAGLDFESVGYDGGGYVTKAELVAAGVSQVTIRYRRLRSAFTVTLEGPRGG